MCIFGQPIHHHTEYCLPLRKGLAINKIHRDVCPYLCRNRQWLEKTYWLLVIYLYGVDKHHIAWCNLVQPSSFASNRIPHSLDEEFCKDPHAQCHEFLWEWLGEFWVWWKIDTLLKEYFTISIFPWSNSLSLLMQLMNSLQLLVWLILNLDGFQPLG